MDSRYTPIETQEWNEFIETLKTVLPLTDIDIKVLRYILDPHFTGKIQLKVYTDFINTYETIENCVSKLKNAFVREFFYGYLSSKEAEVLLCKQSPGTFLLRLSKTNIGSFAISFVYGNQEVGHVLINASAEGYSLADSQQSTAYDSIEAIIDYYKDALTVPYRSPLPLQCWYTGDMSSGETAMVLANEKPGTFLIRLSSQFGFLAASFVDTDRSIKHTLVEQVLGGGYRLPGESRVFATMDAVINYYNAALVYPMRKKNIEFSLGELKDQVLHEYLEDIAEQHKKQVRKESIRKTDEIPESDIGVLVPDKETDYFHTIDQPISEPPKEDVIGMYIEQDNNAQYNKEPNNATETQTSTEDIARLGYANVDTEAQESVSHQSTKDATSHEDHNHNDNTHHEAFNKHEVAEPHQEKPSQESFEEPKVQPVSQAVHSEAEQGPVSSRRKMVLHESGFFDLQHKNPEKQQNQDKQDRKSVNLAKSNLIDTEVVPISEIKERLKRVSVVPKEETKAPVVITTAKVASVKELIGIWEKSKNRD